MITNKEGEVCLEKSRIEWNDETILTCPRKNGHVAKQDLQ